MKQRLRAEIYESISEMGRKGVRIDQSLFELARARLADATLCGKHAKQTEPMPPPQEPAKRSRESATAEPQKRQRAERFEVDSIVTEEPPSKTV